MSPQTLLVCVVLAYLHAGMCVAANCQDRVVTAAAEPAAPADCVLFGIVPTAQAALPL